MPYIKRDASGHIYSIAQQQDNDHIEFIAATSQELVAFLMQQSKTDNTKEILAESDKDIARVTEDLIQLMINKNLILFTDLPNAVQQKLLNREKLRSHLNHQNNSFLDDSESI